MKIIVMELYYGMNLLGFIGREVFCFGIAHSATEKILRWQGVKI